MRVHILLATCLLAACASAPGGKPAATAGASGGEQKPKLNEILLAHGYSAQRKGSDVRYCLRRVPLGSILPRIECYTELQAMSEVDKSDKAINAMRRFGAGACDINCMTQ